MSEKNLTIEDCFKCGLCCYFPLFKNKELKASPDEKHIIVGDDGWCIYFKKETKKCKIHDEKPTACKLFEIGGTNCLSRRKKFNPK